MTKVIRITAKRDGFRRAGIAHPAVATDHAIDRFTAAQLEALEAETMLVVQGIELPEGQAPEASGDGSVVPRAEYDTLRARLDEAHDRIADLEAFPEGSSAQLLEAAIITAIETLEPGNADHFTDGGGGKPHVKAIELILGVAISADRRDRIWAQILAAREAASG